MVLDTKEKPFHCRYCGRRYARKFVKLVTILSSDHTKTILQSHRDLVNRHEKSFHPHADGLSLSKRVHPSEDQNDVIMSEIPSLPTPPSPLSETCSERADCPSRSPWIEDYNQTVSLQMMSPPDLDTMLVDVAKHKLGESIQDVVNPDHAAVLSLLRTDQQVDDTSLLQTLNEQNVSLGDRCSPGSSHLASRPHDIAGHEQWDTATMTCSTTDYEDWLPASRTGPSDVAQASYIAQNMFSDRFDLFTIKSIALNHAALDADLSTYLEDPSAGFQNQIQGFSTHDPVNLKAALPESTSLPIEASILNVGLPSSDHPSILLKMPSLLKETPRAMLTPPTLNENIYHAIMASIRHQIPLTSDMEPLLSIRDMRQFLKCYLVCFHRHCPIIHLPSLNLEAVPCHLIMAMCAIGALYRLRRKTAHDLWQCANQMCEKVRVT
jgi:hypothetical protein